VLLQVIVAVVVPLVLVVVAVPLVLVVVGPHHRHLPLQMGLVDRQLQMGLVDLHRHLHLQVGWPK
jgi:hypothetical protein